MSNFSAKAPAVISPWRSKPRISRRVGSASARNVLLLLIDAHCCSLLPTKLLDHSLIKHPFKYYYTLRVPSISGEACSATRKSVCPKYWQDSSRPDKRGPSR